MATKKNNSKGVIALAGLALGIYLWQRSHGQQQTTAAGAATASIAPGEPSRQLTLPPAEAAASTAVESGAKPEAPAKLSINVVPEETPAPTQFVPADAEVMAPAQYVALESQPLSNGTGDDLIRYNTHLTVPDKRNVLEELYAYDNPVLATALPQMSDVEVKDFYAFQKDYVGPGKQLTVNDNPALLAGICGIQAKYGIFKSR